MKRIQVWIPRIVLIATCGAFAAAIGYAFLPRPVFVEIRSVQRGTLLVTVDEDGITRVREKYVVSAPLPGRLSRVQLHAGDLVEAGKTLLTNLDPTPPTTLDERARAEAEARLKVAEAVRQRCDPVLERAKVTLRFAEEEFERAKQMGHRDAISHEEMDRAELRSKAAKEELRVAEFAIKVADYELALARAAMIHANRVNDSEETKDSDWRIQILAPIDGQVLRVFQESSAVVTAGMPLMEIGDLRGLEVVIDVLSSDAVKISAGNSVLLEEWGGEHPLRGRVRLVEPSGYMKISALGVEEQRVNVLVDMVDEFAERRPLGDNFRVEARVIVDQADNVIKIPKGALFRDGEKHAVFVVVNGRAALRHVQVGRRGGLDAEILHGLSDAEKVIVYPSDKIHDGIRVLER